jgi:hypothetical protein
MTNKLVTRASWLAMAFALSACGGGSTGGNVSSTPTPVPAPTPTPTPSRNDDLVAPLVTESFSAIAVTGTVNYPATGTSSVSAARATMTIAYDAAVNGYIVTVGSRSQTFLPVHLQAGQAADEANIYIVNNGTTSDSLSVSRNSTEMGTIASPQFRYVGGGVWQRTIQGTSGISGTGDAFTYGVSTPASALPRTGTANFPAQLRGLAAFGDSVVAAKGSGTLNVNFSSNGISGTGTIKALSASGAALEGDRRWTASAAISSSANSFSGTFSMSDPFQSTTKSGPNNFAGQFYGPAAQEIGASWSWTDSFLGTTFVGYLLGKNASLFPFNGTLTELVANETFPAAAVTADVSRRTDTGTYLSRFGGNGLGGGAMTFRYDEASSSFAVGYGAFDISETTLTPAKRNATLTSTNFDVYNLSQSTLYNGTQTLIKTITLSLYKPGAGNTQLALSYTGFGTWSSNQPDTPTSLYENIQQGVFAYGRTTAASGVPRTGTGNYLGIISGISSLPTSASPFGGTTAPYRISGTSQLTFDFGALTFTGSMTAVARNTATSTDYNIGTFNFANSSVYPLTAGSSEFRGRFISSDLNPGEITAAFTGPSAQEYRGTWNNTFTDPVNGGTLSMSGIMVGKRQ